eukprot:10631057-Alexandrium_andersonii.AAC.1
MVCGVVGLPCANIPLLVDWPFAAVANCRWAEPQPAYDHRSAPLQSAGAFRRVPGKSSSSG